VYMRIGALVSQASSPIYFRIRAKGPDSPAVPSVSTRQHHDGRPFSCRTPFLIATTPLSRESFFTPPNPILRQTLRENQ
jgi:hypothetical protein